MQLSVDSLRVEIATKGCTIPADERTRVQAALTTLHDRVKDFPEPTLVGHVAYHPHSEKYHVKLKLTLPGRTLLTADEDPYLDTALQRSLAKLTRKVEVYKEHPDREAVAVAENRAALDNEVVAPEDPAAGPLAAAAAAGDYRAFRTALAGYEEWLRKRVGRLIQRHAEAEAQLGKELRIGDVVEEVYLNAFEAFIRRPTNVRLSEWLEALIEPSLRALLRHPDEESIADSLARTVRSSPLA